MPRKKPVPGLETCDGYHAQWGALHPRSVPETTRHNTSRTAKFARQHRGRRLDSITRVEAKQWALRNKGNKGSARYVRAMFNDAIRDGFLEDNPFERQKLPGLQAGRKHIPLRVSEFEPLVWELAAVLDGMGQPGISRQVIVSAYSGLRVSEGCRIRADHVLDGGARLIVKGKRTKANPSGDRTVVVAAPGRAALLDRRGWVRGSVFATMHRQWPFVDEGRAANATIVRFWFNRAKEEVKGWPADATFHWLRHFHCTWLVENGASPFDAGVQLFGHGDVELVLGLYAHAAAEKSLDRLEQALGVGA